jgi:hypothetical protein
LTNAGEPSFNNLPQLVFIGKPVLPSGGAIRKEDSRESARSRLSDGLNGQCSASGTPTPTMQPRLTGGDEGAPPASADDARRPPPIRALAAKIELEKEDERSRDARSGTS